MRLDLLLFVLVISSAVCFEALASEPYDATLFWTDRQPVPELREREYRQLIRLDDGRTAVLGDEFNPRNRDDGRHLVLIGLAANGTEQWRRTLPAIESYGRPHMIAGPGGSLFLCDGSSDYYKIDAFGEIVWHVQYDYYLESTCFEMAYHTEGTLLVAGDRTYGQSLEGVFNSEASLTAYDAEDGTVRWQSGYRPYDGSPEDPNELNFDVLASWLRVTSEGIDWFGWGRVHYGRVATDVPWSFFVSTNGTLGPEESLSLFMAEAGTVASFISTAANDRLMMYHDGELTIWTDGRWRQPSFERLTGPMFGLEPDERLFRHFTVGARDDSLSVVFVRIQEESGLQTHLDLLTKKRNDRKVLSIELPRTPDNIRVVDIVAAADSFSLWNPSPLLALVEEPEGNWRIDRITKVW